MYQFQEKTMNQNKCAASSKRCPCQKISLILLSIIFMVGAAFVLGALMAFPVTIYTYYFTPEIFSSISQAYMCLTPTFALVFLGITVVCRLAHIYLEGSAYLKETFFYDFVTA